MQNLAKASLAFHNFYTNQLEPIYRRLASDISTLPSYDGFDVSYSIQGFKLLFFGHEEVVLSHKFLYRGDNPSNDPYDINFDFKSISNSESFPSEFSFYFWVGIFDEADRVSLKTLDLPEVPDSLERLIGFRSALTVTESNSALLASYLSSFTRADISGLYDKLQSILAEVIAELQV